MSLASMGGYMWLCIFFSLLGAVFLGLAILVFWRDHRRLNWLERTRSEIDTEGPGFVVYNALSGERSELGGGASGGSFRRLRPAIDAAMAAEECEYDGKAWGREPV